jgi:hypothetical protein
MEHCSKAVVRNPARRVVQSATFRAKHTLENIPFELAERREWANLAAEL